MADERITQLARVLVRYSRDVQKGQQVLISGTPMTEPLLIECAREVYRAGGYPFFRMSPSRAGEIMYAEADEDQIGFVPDWMLNQAREVDQFLNIMGSTNTQAYAQVDPTRQVAYEKARREFLDILLDKGEWTLTLFPTPAYAQDAEMGLEEFEDFAFSAMRLDTGDAVAAWEEAKAFQEKILERLEGADEIHIVAEDTDLTLSVKDRTWINCYGSHNMPDGEVFTGPVETSAAGHIRYSYPVCYRGKEVHDVRLVFEEGKVVEATAEKNEAFLNQMIEMDEGASRLGELGIGTNYGIDRFIKNILFDEKIGGTVHLAVGKGYPETKSENKSALHWDMICDLRRGGRIEVDGEVLQADGEFKV